MEENIRFAFKTRDGIIHPVNIDGVCTIIDAVFETASSILNGDLKIDPKDIVAFIDVPG